MARQRMVLTSLWRKSRKFRPCSRDARYLYLYLLSNEDTELCGAYEHDFTDLCHVTQMSREEVTAAFDELERVGLAAYRRGWVLVLNYKANASNPSVKKGIEQGLETLPSDVKKTYDTLSTRSTHAVHTLGQCVTDSDSDSDSDSDIPYGAQNAQPSGDDFETSDFESPPLPAVAGAEQPKSLAPLKEPLARLIDDAFLTVHEYTSIAKERGQVTQLAKKCRARDPTEPEAVARRMLSAFSWLRKNAEPFWRKQPFTPSAMSSLWDRIEAEIESRMGAHAMSAGGREFLEGV